MKRNVADAEEFKNLVVSSGIPYGAKTGPRVHLGPTDSDPNIYFVNALELRPKDIREKLKDTLLQYWRTRSYEHLSVWTDDCLFDFSDMPPHLLDSLLNEFLKNPRGKIFPLLSTLSDGCRLCLENCSAITEDVQILVKHRDEKDLGPATFLLLTAIEEFGKALLILRAAKEAVNKEYKIAIIDTGDGFRDHAEKVGVAGEQLMKIAVNNNIGFTDTLILLDTLSMGETSLGIRRGSLGSVQREYGLYVDYSSHLKKWRSYREHWDRFTSNFNKNKIEDLVKLLKISCDTFLKEIQQKPIDQIREPKDMLVRSISPDRFYGLGKQ